MDPRNIKIVSDYREPKDNEFFFRENPFNHSAIHSVIDGTIATADAVITASVDGGSDISNKITIPNTSNAGTVNSCSPGDNHAVAAGEYIKLTTDGASTNASSTVSAVFTIIITL